MFGYFHPQPLPKSYIEKKQLEILTIFLFSCINLCSFLMLDKRLEILTICFILTCDYYKK